MVKKFIYVISAIILMFSSTLNCDASQFFQDDENIVIVIDPGHGGENYGTDVNENFLEKDINLKTANALIEELSKYPGVTIYTTRTEDVDISLKDRAVFAEEVEADFLFSLHYNASENHTLFGAEVWIPLRAPYHAPAYQFAYLQLQEMEDMGLFIRGIKTRENNSGKDYYGILRECSAREIPAVIIEHCHVDEERDSDFVSSEEMFKEFGKRDARAIATFLNLDGSGEIPFELQSLTSEITIPNTYNDYEEPDICSIAIENADYDTGKLTISVNAVDHSGHIQYYDYSLDGGKTYSIRYPWPGCNGLTGAYEETFSLDLEIPENTKPRVIVRAYNKFDILKDSNMLSAFQVFRPTASDDSFLDFLNEYEADKEYEETIGTAQKDGTALATKRMLLLGGFSLFWILILVFGIRIIIKCLKNESRR